MSSTDKPTLSKYRLGAALAVFLTVALYLLWDEHEAHFLGYGPLILLLICCGAMHFFHHRNHSGRHGPPRRKRDDRDGGHPS